MQVFAVKEICAKYRD